MPQGRNCRPGICVHHPCLVDGCLPARHRLQGCRRSISRLAPVCPTGYARIASQISEPSLPTSLGVRQLACLRRLSCRQLFAADRNFSRSLDSKLHPATPNFQNGDHYFADENLFLQLAAENEHGSIQSISKESGRVPSAAESWERISCQLGRVKRLESARPLRPLGYENGAYPSRSMDRI